MIFLFSKMICLGVYEGHRKQKTIHQLVTNVYRKPEGIFSSENMTIGLRILFVRGDARLSDAKNYLSASDECFFEAEKYFFK